MNEFGETPKIYVWPSYHEPGTPYPDGFWVNLRSVLDAAGVEWEDA